MQVFHFVHMGGVLIFRVPPPVVVVVGARRWWCTAAAVGSVAVRIHLNRCSHSAFTNIATVLLEIVNIN